MSLSSKDSSSLPKNRASETDVPDNEIESQQLGKRNRDDYALDNEFYESKFKWDVGTNKKIKLDTEEDRIEALNARPSFTNLASSVSLILPPEIDTVVITRDKFVVEWNKDLSSETTDIPPPTQVIQVLREEKKEEFQKAIHQHSFDIPLYFCNASTSCEIIDKIREENRLNAPTQISDVENSLSSRLIERYSDITKDAFKAKTNKEKTTNDKLNKTIEAINHSLEYFDHIPAEDVPIRDKRTVNTHDALLFLFFFFIFRIGTLIQFYFMYLVSKSF
jgi:hypothetical protein